MPKYLKPEIINFIGSRMGQDRAVWGTNGLPWKESLDQVDALGLKPEARRKIIRDNAIELFRL
jgi:predicted TIM-barrel fold metal-dependent hydrolase